ncbi:MAG: conjugal transfer protein TraX [Oscillospiraceae bacterium]|nr:conjugal transfer protein TraX [Oscillospiraceae bacterium]
METKKLHFDISSAGLHIIAMVCMLLDHIGAVGLVYNDWIRCVGRIAFPIFAFMTVEGFYRTKNLKKYAVRLLVFAVISEIPFNLMAGGGLFYPLHQNVLWTFLMALGAMWVLERAKQAEQKWVYALATVCVMLLSYIAGIITMADYYGGGVLTVLVFYFFREKKWYNLLGQVAALLYINTEILGGYGYELNFFGLDLFIHMQALALLALLPIWLYNGRKGHSSVAFKYICYVFYPLHMLVLYLIAVFR